MMKDKFNQQVMGVSPEQTRLALTGKTMVEQEQPVPTLKPLGFGQAVDNQMHMEKLAKEHQRVRRYQIKVTETHTTLRMNGKVVSSSVERHVQPINRTKQLTNDFNQETSQAHDMKEIGISY